MSRDAVTKNSVVKRIIHVQILCLKLNLRWKWTIVQDKDTKLSQDSSPLRLMLLALACLKTSRGNRRLRARYHFLVTVFAAHALPFPLWTQWYVNAPKHGQKGDSLCLPYLQTHPPTNTQTLFRGEILIKMTSFAGRGGDGDPYRDGPPITVKLRPPALLIFVPSSSIANSFLRAWHVIWATSENSRSIQHKLPGDVFYFPSAC